MVIDHHGLENIKKEILETCKDPFFKDRRRTIEEVISCFDENKFHAFVITATTQIEGILWDLAFFLSRRGIRILKKERKKGQTVYYGYPVDENGSYTIKKAGWPQYDRKFRILSARSLLERTRLGNCFSREVYFHLVGDFTEERNILAHGKIAPSLVQEANVLKRLFLLNLIIQEGREIYKKPMRLIKSHWPIRSDWKKFIKVP